MWFLSQLAFREVQHLVLAWDGIGYNNLSIALQTFRSSHPGVFLGNGALQLY